MQNQMIESIRFRSRRSFLCRSLAFASAVRCLTSSSEASALEDAPNSDSDHSGDRPVSIFAKHLQLMPWDELAKFCRDIEVTGIEATVRRDGQVEPGDVTEKLPELCDAMAKTDTRVVLIATNINSPKSPHAESVLRTAATLGVTHYRMEYYRYDLAKPILPQLDAFAREAADLAALNHDLGLTGLYQNHAGAKYMGAPLWDLQQVLCDLANEDMAVAYDVRHATVEGNLAWRLDLNMIRDKIGAVYVKDYQAVSGKIRNVSLGEGDVSEDLFAELRKSPPPGPVSLHMEYISHKDPKLVKASADAYRKDREALRRLLGV